VAERTRELTAANESLRREISGRLTAESGLSRSTDFIRRVLAAAPCVLAIYDLNTLHCTFINERVEDLLGYSPDGVLVSEPRFFADVFAAADHQRFRELTMRMAAGVETGIALCTCSLRTATGEERSFGIGIVRVAEADGSEGRSALLAAVPIAAECDDAAGCEVDAGSGRLPK
jgi:PAS domain-containing protein